MLIKLPDGAARELAAGATAADLAAAISNSLRKTAVAARIDGEIRDLSTPLAEGQAVEILTPASPGALEVLRHSTAHVLAAAVQRLWPGTQVTIGPVIGDGFYYDFDKEGGFTNDDLPAIEAEMAKIIAENRALMREVVPRAGAIETFTRLGETYKVEIIRDLPESEPVSIYRMGDWFDLCRGPHIPNTSFIKAFKLTSIAGAYWRGDERNKMLSRIYGTAYFDPKDLKEHLRRLEEAKARDHRRIGKDQDLFSIVDEVGGGLVLWHPRGAFIRKTIEDFWREEHLKNGYELLFTPHIGKADLWKRSGHTDFYKDAMYGAMTVEEQAYFIKPMNCPFHFHIYKSRRRSYRELPLRFAELGTVYRYERSGVMHGLMRVRGFTQDDAHIFVPREQMEEEIIRTVRFSMFFLRTFGFTEFSAYIATRPEKAVGEPAEWDKATEALKRAADNMGLKYEIDQGGGAFYGPKIDIKLRDCIGREWQCSTIQFDFTQPDRFDLSYVAPDGAVVRPYTIHRALLGSIERFFGVLIEHYAGAFPVWLCPVQAMVIPVADRHDGAAQALVARLRAAGLRADADLRNDRMQAKIRDAEKDKIPFMLVIGDKEAGSGGAAIRTRGREDLGYMGLETLISHLTNAAQIPHVST